MAKINHQAEVKRLQDALQQAEHVQTELDRRVFYLKTLYDVSKDIFGTVDYETILKNFLLITAIHLTWSFLESRKALM